MVDPHWGPVEKNPPGARARPKGSRGRRVVVRILQVIGIMTALGLVAGVAIVAIGYSTTKLPDPNADFNTATSFVYYNDGKAQLGTFAIQNRQPLAYKDMPDNMTEAIVAAENRTFWTDKGISIRGMARAAWVIARGGTSAGRLDDHPAVHQDPLPELRAEAHPEVQGTLPGLQDQQAAEQGTDPRGLPQHDLLRARRVRRAGRQQGLLQHRRQEAERPAGRRAGQRGQQPHLLRSRRTRTTIRSCSSAIGT